MNTVDYETGIKHGPYYDPGPPPLFSSLLPVTVAIVPPPSRPQFYTNFHDDGCLISTKVLHKEKSDTNWLPRMNTVLRKDR
jgi:hypothetical protein